MITLAEENQGSILDELANVCQRFRVDLHITFEPNSGMPYNVYKFGSVEWKKDAFEAFTRAEVREIAIRLASAYPDRIYPLV